MQTLLHSKPLAKFSDKRWRAGGMAKHGQQVEPLGGHIHFDVPAYNNIGVFSPAALAVVKACDQLTRCFESLEILHSQEANARRHGQHGYGRLGDVRDCDGRLEYRTPISWLYSPQVAYWVLTGYKLAAAAPESTRDLQPANGSWAALKDWYQQFSGKDIDAERALEKLAARGLKAVQGDPEADIKETWRELAL
jgi:hypothetical protein